MFYVDWLCPITTCSFTSKKPPIPIFWDARFYGMLFIISLISLPFIFLLSSLYLLISYSPIVVHSCPSLYYSHLSSPFYDWSLSLRLSIPPFPYLLLYYPIHILPPFIYHDSNFNDNSYMYTLLKTLKQGYFNLAPVHPPRLR